MRSYGRKLPREDWDFEAFAEKLLNNELHWGGEFGVLYRAFMYEYARSTPALLRAFRRDRNSLRMHEGAWRCLLVVPKDGQVHPEECFPYFDSRNYDPLHLAFDDLPTYEFDELIAPSGFPKTPFLKSDFGTFAYSPSAVNLPSPKTLSKSAAFDGGWIDELNLPAKPNEVVHFRIRWEESDESIRQAFGKWVRENRPEEPLRTRGMSVKRKLWTDLKALGVWRLMRVFDDNVREAQGFCQMQAGKSNYERDDDWRENQARAQLIIDDFSKRIIAG